MIVTTLVEERREVWSAILDEVRQPDRDPARAAACACLLHHMLDSGVPPAKPAALTEFGDAGR
jgi:hypothetical protein